jgi:NTP pyrophosphatase (non-canonical NTP hydrolase)
MSVYSDVVRERGKQRDKWGKQDRTPLEWVVILSEEVGEVAQEALRNHFGAKPLKDYRAELVQVAAVAFAALDNLDKGEA